jgi:hypothetical protein
MMSELDRINAQLDEIEEIIHADRKRDDEFVVKVCRDLWEIESNLRFTNSLSTVAVVLWLVFVIAWALR